MVKIIVCWDSFFYSCSFVTQTYCTHPFNSNSTGQATVETTLGGGGGTAPIWLALFGLITLLRRRLMGEK